MGISHSHTYVAYKINKRLEQLMVFPNLYFICTSRWPQLSFFIKNKKISKNSLKGILKGQGNGTLQMVTRENLTSYESALLQLTFGMD